MTDMKDWNRQLDGENLLESAVIREQGGWWEVDIKWWNNGKDWKKLAICHTWCNCLHGGPKSTGRWSVSTRKLNSQLRIGIGGYLQSRHLKNILKLVRKVAAERSRAIPDTELGLSIMKCAYLMGDITQRHQLLIWKTDSSGSQPNRKEVPESVWERHVWVSRW